MSDWHPEGIPHRSVSRRPEVGDVVAYDRRAWTVRNVDEAEPTPEEAERLKGYRMPRMPYRVILTRLYGAPHERENRVQEIGLRIGANPFRDPLAVYPNGRVPLCSCHSEPWPCIEADQQAEAAHAMKRAEHEMRLVPGFCPACQEPVTSRQRSIRFPGPYVNNPFINDPAFHLRRKCFGSAARYEDAWVATDPTRARSLLTLRCAGTVIVHHDGSAECFGADGSDCPSIYASHRCMSACYVQSHGCPLDCPTTGHPGTRIAGRPDDPRAFADQSSIAMPTTPTNERTDDDE